MRLGGFQLSYRVTSRDGRGRRVGSVVSDLSLPFEDGWVDDDDGSFSGSWSVTSDPRNYGGTSQTSTTVGDSFTGGSFGSADAWVTTTGPNQGSASIYVDGAYVETISTYSKTTHFRRVVWTKRWGIPFAPHTFEIVNLATAGHPESSWMR